MKAGSLEISLGVAHQCLMDGVLARSATHSQGWRSMRQQSRKGYGCVRNYRSS